ncbi:MAG: FecCD family ABC transporter permease, partial [Myxococcota bacterium]
LARSAEGLLPPTRLVLSGVAVAAVLGAVTGFLLQVAPRARAVRAALYWTSGGLGSAAWPAVAGTVALAAVVAFGLWRFASELDRMLLGEEVAASMGVEVPRVRAALLVAGAALTGAVVSLGGAIGFVGLVAPHLGRMLAGSTHRRLAPVAAAVGALLLLAADTLARTAFVPRELPAGVLTAVLGGPFFLALLRRRAYAFAEVA